MTLLAKIFSEPSSSYVSKVLGGQVSVAPKVLDPNPSRACFQWKLVFILQTSKERKAE